MSSHIQIAPNIYVSHQVLYQSMNSRSTIDMFKRVVDAANKTIVKQFRKHLPEETKFNGIDFILRNIKANGVGGLCRYVNGKATIEVNYKYARNNVKKLSETIAHELVHAEQYLSGRLAWDYRSARYVWEGSINSNKGSTYQRYRDQPWEVEAFSSQEDLANIILNSLPQGRTQIDMTTSNGLVR